MWGDSWGAEGKGLGGIEQAWDLHLAARRGGAR